jgi:hypothetical protein
MVGVAVVVIALVVVSILWLVPALNKATPTPCASCQAQNHTVPLGTSLALGSPIEAAKGGNNWYNFSVEAASGGLRWGNLTFQVQDLGGSIIHPSSGWTMQVLGITGSTIGSYSWTANAWSLGSSLTVVSPDELAVDSGATSLSGDELVVIGGGAFSGSTSVVFP